LLALFEGRGGSKAGASSAHSKRFAQFGCGLAALCHRHAFASFTPGPHWGRFRAFGHWCLARADQFSQQPFLLLESHQDLRRDWRSVFGELR
jgi:hypothetical protein